ncbi:MAG: hypothetical protein ABSH11_00805 [Verrucomicrobiota bacterium]
MNESNVADKPHPMHCPAAERELSQLAAGACAVAGVGKFPTFVRIHKRCGLGQTALRQQHVETA